MPKLDPQLQQIINEVIARRSAPAVAVADKYAPGYRADPNGWYQQELARQRADYQKYDPFRPLRGTYTGMAGDLARKASGTLDSAAKETQLRADLGMSPRTPQIAGWAPIAPTPTVTRVPTEAEFLGGPTPVLAVNESPTGVGAIRSGDIGDVRTTAPTLFKQIEEQRPAPVAPPADISISNLTDYISKLMPQKGTS